MLMPLITLVSGNARRSKYHEQIHQRLHPKETEAAPSRLGPLGSTDDLRHPRGDTTGSRVPAFLLKLSYDVFNF